MLLEDWACVSDSLARDFKFAPEDSFDHWKTIVGLDLQNLVDQAQYLSKFDQKYEVCGSKTKILAQTAKFGPNWSKFWPWYAKFWKSKPMVINQKQ